MRKLTRKLLDKVVLACDKPEGTKSNLKVIMTPSRFRWYHEATTTERLQVHQELEQLASHCPSFSISYANQGFDAVPILESLAIDDGQQFLEVLRITPKNRLLESSAQQASDLLAMAPDWLSIALADLPTEWLQNRASNGFSFKQIDKLELAIKVASWVETSGAEACDFRTASVQALGNTKLLENNLSWVARVLATKHPERLSNLSNREVLEAFGLSKFCVELKLRGDCLVHYTEGAIPIRLAKPYISLPTTEIESITIGTTPKYVLMIENLTTFKRYCSEIKDDGLVAYTGGFPSHSWVRLMKPLLANIKSNPPIFHWGDIDLGGYRILSYLTSTLEVDLIPYRMIGVEAPDSNNILNIRELHQALGGRLSGQLLKLSRQLEAMLEKGVVIRAVEQELLPIKTPVN
jgi:hypothetical protein